MKAHRLSKKRLSTYKLYALAVLIPLLITTVLTAVPARADPPGSPPPWGWNYISSTDQDSFTIGSVTNITVEIGIEVNPNNGWGNVSAVLHVETERSNIAYAYLVSGLAAFFDGDTNEFIGAGTEKILKPKNHDGIFCDHLIYKKSMNDTGIVYDTVTVGGMEVIKVYRVIVAHMVHEKTGLFCEDKEESFVLYNRVEVNFNSNLT